MKHIILRNIIYLGANGRKASFSTPKLSSSYKDESKLFSRSNISDVSTPKSSAKNMSPSISLLSKSVGKTGFNNGINNVLYSGKSSGINNGDNNNVHNSYGSESPTTITSNKLTNSKSAADINKK